MLAEVDTAATADAKGAALESLSSYIFARVHGIRVADRNVWTENRDMSSILFSGTISGGSPNYISSKQ